jgi:hypothetical protein
VPRDLRSGDDFMVISPSSLSARFHDPQPGLGADTRKVDESLPSEFLLTLYLTLRGFGRAKAFKNPVNAGENRGKPVVGIEPI